MQVKNNTSIEMEKTKKWFWIGLKTSITLLCFYFLYDQFQSQNIFFDDLVIPRYFVPILSLQFFLMILNWYLEILRWKISVNVVEGISFKQAVIDVLGGLTMNWILPFTTGDFIARIVSKKDKYQTSAAILLNRAIMLSLTLVIGVYGVSWLLEDQFDWYYVLGSLMLVLFVLTAIYKVLPKKINSYFKGLEKQILLRILGISVGRYMVFFLQFIILLKLFNLDLSIELLAAGIGWIFFVRSSIPSLLGGLGLRETSALIFFKDTVNDLGTIVFPVFILWLLNTALPSIIGAIMLWKLKSHNSMDSHNIA